MGEEVSRHTFGSRAKQYRLEKKITLREFCRRSGIDPGNWSKIERNILPPTRSSAWFESVKEALELDPLQYGNLECLIPYSYEQLYHKQQATIDKLVRALEKISKFETCAELHPGCEKYKSYEDGWHGVAEYAGNALKEAKSGQDKSTTCES